MYNGIRFLAFDTDFKEMMLHMQSMELMSIDNQSVHENSMEMDHLYAQYILRLTLANETLS